MTAGYANPDRRKSSRESKGSKVGQTFQNSGRGFPLDTEPDSTPPRSPTTWPGKRRNRFFPAGPSPAVPSAQIRPVPGAPALLVTPAGRRRCWVVIADLHLGLGEGARSLPGPPEASPARLADSLVEIVHSTGAGRVVLAGDVKHPIVGTPRALRPVIFDFFSRLLSEELAVEVVLGNHDVGLVPHLPREVVVHSAAGMARDGVGVFHGHRWPSRKVLACERLVAGHLHPGYRFAPSEESPSGKVACWVRTEFPVVPQGSSPRKFAAREMVVLPAFHPLAGREALNRQKPRRGRTFLFHRFLGEGAPRAYLLDGTDVGPIVTPRSVRRSGSPRRAAPAP
jgi:metallophosphoesterase superfamily enzyme